MIKYTAEKIAQEINGILKADANISITGIGEPEHASPGEIVCFFDKIDKFPVLPQASLFVVSDDSQTQNRPCIVVEKPKQAFIKLLDLFDPYKQSNGSGFISPDAAIGKHIVSGKNTKIFANVFIGDDVTIGDRCSIYPGVYIGNKVTLGDNVILKPSVVIESGTQIGNNVTIHSGSVIGSDGFGYIEVDGNHIKMPQIGNVIIEDNVEIGANVCIDRATLSSTIIKKGTKIDNLVQIAHNCHIGENCIIVSQVGISGSCNLGSNCVLAGQVGIADHVNLANGVIALSKSGIPKSVSEEKKVVWGYPAKEANEMRRIVAGTTKLPELIKRVKKIETQLEKILNGESI